MEHYFCKFDKIKIELPQRKLPLTVIIAMRENETSILLASDGEAIEGGETLLRLPSGIKLQCHPAASIAWATSGNPTIGDEEFGTWIKSYKWPPKDWRTFSEQAIKRLSELNGRQRHLVKLSGKESTKDDTAECLLVGWLDRPEIYEFNDAGKATPYWSIGFQAIGYGKAHAWIAYKTLDSISTMTPLEKLKRIMEVVTTTMPGCGPPCSIWRVTQDSITDALE